jgi:hypothetical protein
VVGEMETFSFIPFVDKVVENPSVPSNKDVTD